MPTLRASLKRWASVLFNPIPSHLSRNFIEIPSSRLAELESSIRTSFHTGWRSERRYSTAAYGADLHDHLTGRLEWMRRVLVPWFDQVKPLRGTRMLEIGCGTGASTIALAEQGVETTGIDIDEGALQVAEVRARAYGVGVHLRSANASSLASLFAGQAFDAIVFFACLEHMTVPERLTSLAGAWALLPPGGLLIVVETPNRLWYFDDHTSMLPFFDWLPDELAFRYARFSPRENFRELYREPTSGSDETYEHFLRRGRGVSFHEFDLAIAPTRSLQVVSSLSTFQRLQSTLGRSRLDRLHRTMLQRACPGLHPGFYDPFLYFVIRKT